MFLMTFNWNRVYYMTISEDISLTCERGLLVNQFRELVTASDTENPNGITITQNSIAIDG